VVKSQRAIIRKCLLTDLHVHSATEKAQKDYTLTLLSDLDKLSLSVEGENVENLTR
jgi:hypothetical protein